MNLQLDFILKLFLESFALRRDVAIRFMKEQILIQKEHLGNIQTTPEERERLLAIGKELDHNIKDLLIMVHCKTYKRWVNQESNPPQRVGRPKTSDAIKMLIIRLASDVKEWGYRRIVGELKKLGEKVSFSTVRNIIKDSKPRPLNSNEKIRKPFVAFKLFLAMHMETAIACDFFSKKVLTICGFIDAYSLMFIHLGSRKVWCSPVTFNPDNNWCCQQARNVQMWLDDNGIEPKYLVRDRDSKYEPKFDELWKSIGVKIIKTPPRCPKANAFAESWIGHFKKECADHFTLLYGRSMLDYVIRQYVRYYNEYRPHQSLDNTVPNGNKSSGSGAVKSKKILGGLFRHYYREAA